MADPPARANARRENEKLKREAEPNNYEEAASSETCDAFWKTPVCVRSHTYGHMAKMTPYLPYEFHYLFE